MMPRCFGASGSVRTRSSPNVGDLAERAPDLLAVHHVVVAVAHGAGAQRREVGAGAGLGEALAPHLVAAQDLAAGARAFCSSVPSAMSVGPACSVPTKFTPTYGARARVVSSRKISCSVGERVPRRRTPSASACPRTRRRTGAAASRCPSGRRAAQSSRRGLGRELGQRRGEPLAQLGAERLVGVGVPEIHQLRVVSDSMRMALPRTSL